MHVATTTLGTPSAAIPKSGQQCVHTESDAQRQTWLAFCRMLRSSGRCFSVKSLNECTSRLQYQSKCLGMLGSSAALHRQGK